MIKIYSQMGPGNFPNTFLDLNGQSIAFLFGSTIHSSDITNKGDGEYTIAQLTAKLISLGASAEEAKKAIAEFLEY